MLTVFLNDRFFLECATWAAVYDVYAKAFAGKPGLNLSPAFFLKKIATFAAAPYHKTLFADSDTCMCGGHLDDMWRELDDHELIHTIDPAKNQGVRKFEYITTAELVGVSRDVNVNAQ